MRTKTLLLTAAVIAVGAIASQAQVYSVNAVGYVNVTIKNGYNLICNPLNGTNNLIGTVIPTTISGGTVFKWDAQAQGFAQANTYFDGAGWLDGDFNPSTATLNPGEGFFFQNSSGSDTTLTFVGEVPQGNLTNRLGTQYGFYSSIVPQSAVLSALSFPTTDGLTFNAWDPVLQTYKQAYFVLGGTWYDPDFNPNEPTVNVGEGFLLLNSTGGPLNWGRTFNVNN